MRQVYRYNLRFSCRVPPDGAAEAAAPDPQAPSLALLLSCPCSAASFTFGLMTAIASEIPLARPGPAPDREVDGYIYANDGKTVLAVLRGSRAACSSRDEISPRMKQAIVAVEDRRFYEHRGVDLRGIVRAVWADIRNKAVVEGGSTITQQFVKNAYIRNQRSIARKLQGGRARLAARAALVEGADPHRVPEHDLLRQRRLRRRAGGADLLRHTARPH